MKLLHRMPKVGLTGLLPKDQVAGHFKAKGEIAVLSTFCFLCMCNSNFRRLLPLVVDEFSRLLCSLYLETFSQGKTRILISYARN